MLTPKEKQLIKKIKAKRRLHRLRKKTLSARKKTISLQKSRWLRGASVEQLPLMLSTKPALRQLYLSARSKLTIECKVNRRLSQYRAKQRLRFSRATSKLSIRAKQAPVVNSLPKSAEGAIFDPNPNQALFAQKRRALFEARKLRLAARAVRVALPVKKIKRQRGRLLRRKYQLSLLLRRIFLRPIYQKLSSRVARAERFKRDESQRLYQTSTPSSSTLLLASAKQELKRVSSVARKLTASKSPRPNRAVWSYQRTHNFAAGLAKKLKTAKAGSKYKSNTGVSARVLKLTNTYRRAKESLRARFFLRRALNARLTSNVVPTSTRPSLYSHNVRKRPTYSTILPLSRRLVLIANWLRFECVAQNSQKTPNFSKQLADTHPRLRRLPRRSKRVLAATRREIKKMLSLGKQRRRLGERRKKPSKRLLVNISHAGNTGRQVSWRQPISRQRKARLLKLLAWLRTSQRKLLLEKKALGHSAQALTAVATGIRQSRRSALWALLGAVKHIKANFSKVPTPTLAVLNSMAMKLRSGLRCGAYSSDKILSNFLFLVNILAFDAVEQKKLYFALQRWQAVRTVPAAAHRRSKTKVHLAGTKLAVTGNNGYRCRARAALSSSMPRPLALPQPVPTLAPNTKALTKIYAESTPYALKLTVTPEGDNKLLLGASEAYAVPHGVALASVGTHQKKRLLPRLVRRQSRFSRFIPSRAKSRLLRKMVTARNKDSAPTARFPVVRFFNQFYTQGNRIFSTRYRVGLRVAAKRLVKQTRWSRATLLRLSRRRLAWRRVPQGRQGRSSTGRVTTSAPYVGINRGWRARKSRIKQRRLLRTQVEKFKALVRHTGPTHLHTVSIAQTTLPPRVLQLATANENLLPPAVTPGTAAVVFHAAQRRLTGQLVSRAVRAKSVFGFNVFRFSGDDYRRNRGRFLATSNTERKHPRKPRWVRLLAKAEPQALNFAPLIPKRLPAVTVGNNTAPCLRGNLWADVSRRASAKGPVETPSANPDKALLIKKLRRLSLLKTLLLTNKFNKLARLGELKALGDYKYLGELSKLSALGSVTEELKAQLLLNIAIDIKHCAALCVTTHSVQQQTALTTHSNVRTLLTYNKGPIVPGKDAAFFQPYTEEKRRNPFLRAKNLALVNALTKTKNKLVTRRQDDTGLVNRVLARTAWTKRAARVAALRRCRANLLAKVHLDEAKAEQLKLLCDDTSVRILRQGVQRKHQKRVMAKSTKRSTPYFIRVRRLPPEYKKTVCTVTSARNWVTRLGRWVKSTSFKHQLSHARGQTLPKAFSTVRPWGVKVAHLGSITKDYGRLLDAAREALISFKTRKVATKHKAKVKPPVALLTLRLAAARAVYAHRLPRILHLAPATSGDRFWQLRLQSRDQVQLQAEQHLKALARSRNRVSALTSKIARRRAVTRHVKAERVKFLPKKVVAAPKVTAEFTSHYIKDLKQSVFDSVVYINLQKYCSLLAKEKTGQQGYDFVRRAYKAALSSQERNPKLPQLQFEQQKAALVPLLTELGGTAPSAVVLEWNKLPKNKVLPQATAPATLSEVDNSPVITTGGLTATEIESIRDEATRKHLKIFMATASAARQNNQTYLLVKKAVLHSWTRVEESTTPKESPYYNDLLLAAKAYKFYGVTLDLTSRVATNAKLATTFAKLHK